MGIGDSIGKFAIGAVQGLDYGIGRGMELRHQYNQLQDEGEVRYAKQELGKQFQEAAEAGGLDKMGNDWFAKAGANILRTGDLQNATAFMQMGTAIRTQKAQAAGQRASIALAAGNPTAAVVDLNNAFDAMGIPGKITGLTPDGTAYTMADGTVMPAQRALDVTTKLMLTPKDALAYALDQQQANTAAAVGASNIQKNQAQTESTLALLGPKIAELQSQAQANRASQFANTALGKQREVMTPYMAQGAQAEAAAKTVQAQQAISMAPLEREKAALGIAGERQRQAIAEEGRGVAMRQAEAEALQAEQNAAVPPVSTDTRWQGTNASVKMGSEMWDQANTDPMTGQLKDEAVNNMANPFSPVLRGVTAGAAAKLMAQPGAANLSGDAAVQQAAATVNGVVQLIASNPANMELDPVKTASAVNQLLSYGQNVEQMVQSDEAGQYILMNIDGNDTKVYVSPPQQQAIPAP